MRRSFSRALSVIIAFGTWTGALSGAMATDTGLNELRAASLSRNVQDTATIAFEITFPAQPGKYTIQAELKGAEGHPVKSLRDIEVLGRAKFQKAAEAKKLPPQ